MRIRYIFSINAGRSGSDYLTELLSKATNAVSIHEGFPIMNGTAMQKFNKGDDSELRVLMPLKMKEIHKKTKDGRRIYCETNHSYIKGWGYLVPDEYIPQEEIGVIILRRDLYKTAYSLLRIHNVPGASEWNRTWYLTPNAPRNLSRPLDDAGPYDLCKWYVEEINMRAEDYKRRFPKITYFECDLKQLNDYGYVVQLFKTFGLKPSSRLKEVCSGALNMRIEWPKLPLEELTATPSYPSADDLSPEERDALIGEMIPYLHANKAEAIAMMEADYMLMGGSLALQAVSIVAHAEKELEDKFKYALKYTETEHVLIWEFLRSVDPRDSIFVCANRSSAPGISYTYNFNIVPNVRTVTAKLGLIIVPKILWLMAKCIWGRDYTHHRAKR